MKRDSLVLCVHSIHINQSVTRPARQQSVTELIQMESENASVWGNDEHINDIIRLRCNVAKMLIRLYLFLLTIQICR